MTSSYITRSGRLTFLPAQHKPVTHPDASLKPACHPAPDIRHISGTLADDPARLSRKPGSAAEKNPAGLARPRPRDLDILQDATRHLPSLVADALIRLTRNLPPQEKAAACKQLLMTGRDGVTALDIAIQDQSPPVVEVILDIVGHLQPADRVAACEQLFAPKKDLLNILDLNVEKLGPDITHALVTLIGGLASRDKTNAFMRLFTSEQVHHLMHEAVSRGAMEHVRSLLDLVSSMPPMIRSAVGKQLLATNLYRTNLPQAIAQVPSKALRSELTEMMQGFARSLPAQARPSFMVP